MYLNVIISIYSTYSISTFIGRQCLSGCLLCHVKAQINRVTVELEYQAVRFGKFITVKANATLSFVPSCLVVVVVGRRVVFIENSRS